MVRESLARKFRPAGFEQPEGSRHEYTKPRPELQEAFYRWVDELPRRHIDMDEFEGKYRKANEAIKYLGEIPYRETNSLLANFYPKTDGQRCAGLFFSACYNQSAGQVIIYDFDLDDSDIIDCIGYRLKNGKFLVNNGSVGMWFALFSSGIAVNNGEAGHFSGWGSRSESITFNNGTAGVQYGAYSSGLVFNNGKALEQFGYNSFGLVVALRRSKRYGEDSQGMAIESSDCRRIPRLRKYLEELSESTRNLKDDESAKMFLEMYGPELKEKIETEIKKILEGKGKL